RLEGSATLRNPAAHRQPSGRRLPAYLQPRSRDDLRGAGPGRSACRGGAAARGREAFPDRRGGGAEARKAARGVPVERLGILISGRGSNMEAIAANIERGELDAKIAVVISNRPDAPGLEIARLRGLEAIAIPSRGLDRELYDGMLVDALRNNRVDLVCL